MTGPIVFARTPHDEAEELLPWYATGQLEEADRAKVRAHLSHCDHCRQQLAIERRLIGEFQTMIPELESGWVRLRNRVEGRTPVPINPPRPNRPNRLGDAWALLSRPAVATLAAAQLAFVVIAGAVLVSVGQPMYHTLASTPAAAAGNVIVIFRADATEQDIRHVLRSAGASLVDGPTPANAYLLHVSPVRRQLALRALQSSDYVQLAQPIDGSGL